MGGTSPGLRKARQIFREHGGMLRTSKALGLGIHPRVLYALRDAGEVEQISRGVYRLSSAQPLSHPDLVPIAIRIPHAVLCLVSALVHHQLTTQVPHSIDIAVPSHARVPVLDGIPLRTFWYPDDSFRAGVEVFSIDDVSIKVYSPEKTIADCFKYRNKIGLDIAIEALRSYRVRTAKPARQELAKFAQINRVERVMRPYLEAIL
jgi:predicted transcriptional regulator of viral defense system